MWGNRQKYGQIEKWSCRTPCRRTPTRCRGYDVAGTGIGGGALRGGGEGGEPEQRRERGTAEPGQTTRTARNTDAGRTGFVSGGGSRPRRAAEAGEAWTGLALPPDACHAAHGVSRPVRHRPVSRRIPERAVRTGTGFRLPASGFRLLTASPEDSRSVDRIIVPASPTHGRDTCASLPLRRRRTRGAPALLPHAGASPCPRSVVRVPTGMSIDEDSRDVRGNTA